jgi:hypothetical protein
MTLIALLAFSAIPDVIPSANRAGSPERVLST